MVPRGDVVRGHAAEHLVAPRAQVPRQPVKAPQSKMVRLKQDARRADGRKGKLVENGVVVALGIDYEHREVVTAAQVRPELGCDAEAAHAGGLDVLNDCVTHAVARHRPLEALCAPTALGRSVSEEPVVLRQVRAVERRDLRRPVARALAARDARLRARVGGEAARVAVVAAPVARRVRQVDRVHLEWCVAARVAHRRVDEINVRRPRCVVPLEVGKDVRHGLEQRGGPPARDSQGRRIGLIVRGRFVDVGADLEEGGRVRVEGAYPPGRRQAAHRRGRRAQRLPLPLPRLREPARRVFRGLLEPARRRSVKCLAPSLAAGSAAASRGVAQGGDNWHHAILSKLKPNGAARWGGLRPLWLWSR